MYSHYIIIAVGILLGALINKLVAEEPWEKKLREIKQRHAKEGAQKGREQMEQEDKMEKSENEQAVSGSISMDIGTRDLLIRVLQELGCPVHENEQEDLIFQFQGQHFVAVASNDRLCIIVHYPWWLQCSLFDVERLAKIKKAINEANFCTRVASCYTVADEGDVVGVHSQKNFLFIPQIPDIAGYLKAMLEDFFQAHHFVLQELDRVQ